MAQSLFGRAWGWIKGTVSEGARAVAEKLDWTKWRVPGVPGTREEQKKAFREQIAKEEKYWEAYEKQRINGPSEEAKKKARITAYAYVSNMRDDPSEERYLRAKAFVVRACDDGLITYAQKQRFLRLFNDALVTKQIQPKVEKQLQAEDYAGAYHTIYTAPLTDDTQRQLGAQVTQIAGLPPEMTPPANTMEHVLRLGRAALTTVFDVPMQMAQQGLRKRGEAIQQLGRSIEDFHNKLEQHSVLAPLAALDPLPLFSDILVGVGRHYGGGPVTEKSWGEVIAAARQGRRLVPDYTEVAVKALPEDATPQQRAQAIIGGLLDNMVTDPWAFVLSYFDIIPRLGTSVNRARDAVLRNVIRKFGVSHDEAVNIARAMRVVTEDPNFDMVAFSNKGFGTTYFREIVRDALHQGGRGMAREQADEIARYAVGALANKTRRTIRFFDRELIPRGFPEDPITVKADRVERIFKAAEAGLPKRLPKLATEVEAARPSAAAAARKASINVDEIERIAERWGLAVHEEEAAKALAEAAIDEAARSGSSIAKTIAFLKRIALARGDVPAELDVPLRSVVTRSSAVERNWGAYLAEPVADLSPAEKTTVARYLAHYPRQIKNEARAAAMGMNVGDVWGATPLERLRILYAEAGLDPNDAAQAIRGEEIVTAKLPPAVRRLYVAAEKFADRMRMALEEIERWGYEIGDEGFGYITRLPITRPVTGMMRTERNISSGTVRVMHQATTEHPGWAPLTRAIIGESADDVVDLAAAEKQVANWSTDLNKVARTYGALMGQLNMHSGLVNFAQRYGIPRSAITERVIRGARRAAALELSPDLVEQAMRAEGWEPLVRRLTDREARYQGLEKLADWGEAFIREPSQSLGDYYLPAGVGAYLERQLKGVSPLRRTVNKYFSLHRMAGINSPTFAVAQFFEQPFNIAQSRSAQRFMQGTRFASLLLANDMKKVAEASIGSIARNWLKTRRWSATEVYPLIEDLYFRGLSHPVNVARLRDIALKAGLEPEEAARYLKFVLDNDVAFSGPIQALNVGKETGRLIGDELLRSTLGFTMRWIGGPMESFARMSSAFALKLQGLSDPDALRQLARGFVPYERAARGPIDDAAQMVAYYWQYNARKPFQTMRWFMERPLWLWAVHRTNQSLYDGLLNDKEKLMIQGRTWPNQMRPNVLPWSWDVPPFSWYNVSDDLKNNALPNVAIRTPAEEAIPDLFRYIGVTERGISPGRGLWQSSHPLIRALGSVLQDPSNWKAALNSVMPYSLKYLGVEVRPLNRENLDKMYRWQGVPLNPPPGSGITLSQWRAHYDKLFTEMRSLQDRMGWAGFLTRVDLKGPLVRRMPPDALDRYNELRRAEGQPPFLYSAHQGNLIRKTYKDAGFVPPTLGDINAVVSAGGNPSGYAMRGIVIARELREKQMSFADWRLTAQQRMAAGGTPTPLPEGALTEVMQLGAKHDIAFDPDTLQQLAQRPYPASLPAINKFFSDYYHQPKEGVKFDKGYCARSFGQSLVPVFGKRIKGHANQWPKILIEHGWEEVDTPQPGDAFYTKAYGGPIGHVGWVIRHPETKELVALSNIGGAEKSVIQPLKKGRYFRPPRTTGLELYLKQLKLQP